MKTPNILYHTTGTASAEAKKMLATDTEKELVEKRLKSVDGFSNKELQDLSPDSLRNIEAALAEILEQIVILQAIVPMRHEVRANITVKLLYLKTMVTFLYTVLNDGTYHSPVCTMESWDVGQKVRWLLSQIKNEIALRNKHPASTPYRMPDQASS